MAIRKANAVWRGSLAKGSGTMSLGSGAFSGKYSVGSRFETSPGTNPEELIGAAHAGCFSMAFSAILGKNGYTPDSIETEARVHIEKIGDGFTITKIELDMAAGIPEIKKETFIKLANEAKEGCPVSRALAGPQIMLTARLV